MYLSSEFRYQSPSSHEAYITRLFTSLLFAMCVCLKLSSLLSFFDQYFHVCFYLFISTTYFEATLGVLFILYSKYVTKLRKLDYLICVLPRSENA